MYTRAHNSITKSQKGNYLVWAGYIWYNYKKGPHGSDCMLKKSEMPECPVATTVQLIGSKWKLLILRNLLVRPWRFNELKRDLSGISQKVLSDTLHSMESDGLVIRTVYPEVPIKVEYSLSDLGKSMRPIIQSMESWGTAYKNARN